MSSGSGGLCMLTSGRSHPAGGTQAHGTDPLIAPRWSVPPLCASRDSQPSVATGLPGPGTADICPIGRPTDSTAGSHPGRRAGPSRAESLTVERGRDARWGRWMFSLRRRES
ncbi:hypothetical protein FRAAL1124 [Frankia alni ACN14a]|uniref:Uncharacterized protein n=1 Tax=Frankia alni (strain DSM 45986 / CECT 9034 / ACN14a) TaxID=326424 RepID=Q0RRM9_FRAAA|nr:hypothetical protein FRAAL1124 [Frankia alni ACN14a]